MPPSDTQRSSFGRALGNVGWLLSSKGVGAVLSLVYLALATRTLGIRGFGEFALILGAAQGVAALVGFESWQGVVRFGIRHLHEGARDKLLALIRFSLLLDIVAALIGCGVAVVALAVMRARFGWSADLARDAFLFALVTVLSVRSTAIGVLRLHDRFALGAVADSVTPIARFFGALFAVWQHATVSGFLIAWALGEVLTAVTYWISAARVQPGILGRPASIAQVAADNPGIIRFAWQTNLATTLNAASRQFAVVVVGFVAGPVAAGGYRLAYQLSLALLRGSDLFARAVFPEVARAHAKKDSDDLATLARNSARFTVSAGLITCIAVPLLGSPALHVIGGKDFGAVYPLLVLLGIAASLDIMAVGFEPLLIGTGRAATALRIRLLSVAVLFGGMIAFMAKWGAVGAGIANIMASALALALLVISVRRLRT
ncbi:MAG TPA: lipopolysaccharide biosynthesis protein [Sphingobium sp.]|uniref:lipopolysaccharide biosynthesis protein n=1 Tax=Sphingobium sp. TaxID=1912891 RepID=UPI002ED0B910